MRRVSVSAVSQFLRLRVSAGLVAVLQLLGSSMLQTYIPGSGNSPKTCEPYPCGEVEVDESYFGGHRKGNRGRGAAGKVIVFGILKRNGRVYTRPVPNVGRSTLRLIIKQKVPDGSTIYSDSFGSYDGLITDGYRHHRINHATEFTHGKRNHINGIESFWSYAKAKMQKHYGVPRNRFYLYLKEMEYQYNHRNEDLVRKLKRLFTRGRY